MPKVTLIGTKIGSKSGVSHLQTSRITLDTNKTGTPYLSISESAAPNRIETEEIVPIRNLQSAALHIPDNSYCKFIAGTLGFVLGVTTGTTVGMSGRSSAVSSGASAAVVGGLGAVGIFTLCSNRQAVLYLHTQREDYTFGIQAPHKEQSRDMFNAIKESL